MNGAVASVCRMTGMKVRRKRDGFLLGPACLKWRSGGKLLEAFFEVRIIGISG